MVPRVKIPRRKLLQKSTNFQLLRFWRDRKAPELATYNEGFVRYNSNQRIDRFLNILVMVLGMGMLIAPMWILVYLTTDEAKLGTITAFVMTFLGILSTVTATRPFEILGATTA